MKNLIRFLLFVAVFALVVPQVTYAAWWNPFTWKTFSKKIEVKIERVVVATSTQTKKTEDESQKPKEEIVAESPKLDQSLEIQKLKKEVDVLKKNQERIATPVPVATVPVPKSPIVESWESLEQKYFIDADTKEWTSLILTNLLGETRYYRKEGVQWVRKNTEVEAAQRYVDPKALENFNSLMSALDKKAEEAKSLQAQAMGQQRKQNECLMQPTPVGERTLSPQQQQYMREQRCGTATPQSDLNYKLYQQQQYQDCVTQNPSKYDLYCSYLKPSFY